MQIKMNIRSKKKKIIAETAIYFVRGGVVTHRGREGRK